MKKRGHHIDMIFDANIYKTTKRKAKKSVRKSNAEK